MESTKTQKMVLAAMLAALGMILNLIEIPYPFAPWLNLDLSEIVVLVAISTLGFVPALFVCICKFYLKDQLDQLRLDKLRHLLPHFQFV